MDKEKGGRKLLILMLGRDWYGNIIGKSYSAFLNNKSIQLLVCMVIIGIWRSIALFLRRRLGDKACPGCWASGSPRHACVWHPPYEIRRRLGVERRRASA